MTTYCFGKQDDYAHTLDRANLTRLDSDRNIFCNLHTKDVTFGHPISGLKGREALLALMQKQSHEDIFNTTLHWYVPLFCTFSIRDEHVVAQFNQLSIERVGRRKR